MTQFLHLADNDFKVAIIHLLREPKKKKKSVQRIKGTYGHNERTDSESLKRNESYFKKQTAKN